MFLLDILKHNTHNTDNENICDLCGEKFKNLAIILNTL
jgi:hypothetical protein